MNVAGTVGAGAMDVVGIVVVVVESVVDEGGLRRGEHMVGELAGGRGKTLRPSRRMTRRLSRRWELSCRSIPHIGKKN